MKKIKNPKIREYVMSDNMWKFDLPAFLKESQLCTEGNAYDVCWNILRRLLVILTERAIELDDPVLNIIMLNLSLYDNSHTEEGKEAVKKLRQIIKEKNL